MPQARVSVNMLMNEDTELFKELRNRCRDLQELLREFGLTLHAFDPGVTVSLDGAIIHFDEQQWRLLEPLLGELRHWRERQAI